MRHPARSPFDDAGDQWQLRRHPIDRSAQLARRGFLLATCGLAALPRRASADLYDDYINSTSKEPFVAFLARGGVPGHAFVAIGVRLNAGLEVYERFFGYYPAGDGKLSQAKLVFGKESGKLDYRWADLSWDETYRVSIDDTKRAAALAVIERWRSKDPKYNLFALGGKNCSVFASEVAVAIGLKAASGPGAMLPVDYIRALRRINTP